MRRRGCMPCRSSGSSPSSRRSGRTVNGSRSWIPLVGGFTVQPAEVAKVGLCLALAGALAGQAERGSHRAPARWLVASVLVALPAGLVLLQPDLGSAAVIIVLGVVVVAVAGVPRRWLVGASMLAMALLVVVLTTPVLSDYQRDRLTAFADPSADPQGSGYQTHQVRLAIGAGGLWGRGFMRGGAAPRAVSCPTSSTTSSSPSRGRSWVRRCHGADPAARLRRRADARRRVARPGPLRTARRRRGGDLAGPAGRAERRDEPRPYSVTGLPLPFVSYGGSSMLVCWVPWASSMRRTRRATRE